MSKTEMDKIADELVKLSLVARSDMDDIDILREADLENQLIEVSWSALKGVWDKAAMIRGTKLYPVDEP